MAKSSRQGFSLLQLFKIFRLWGYA